MLVLSRRENDRIIFPALGISVEVMKLSRNRASLGICAPKGIRIIRHELLDEMECSPSSEGLVEAIRQRFASQIQDEIESATQKLRTAHEDLVAGDTEQALATIGQAIAELERLRNAAQSAAQSAQNATCDDESLLQSADQWTVAESIAEPTTGYTNSAAEHTPDEIGRVLWVDPADGQDGDFLSDLGELGFQVDQASDALVTLYEFARQDYSVAI